MPELHTPTPWTLHEGQWADHSDDGGGGFHIRMADFDDRGGFPGHLIQYAEGLYPENKGYDEVVANATLIVTAVNERPALLARVAELEARVAEGERLAEMADRIIAACHGCHDISTGQPPDQQCQCDDERNHRLLRDALTAFWAGRGKDGGA